MKRPGPTTSWWAIGGLFAGVALVAVVPIGAAAAPPPLQLYAAIDECIAGDAAADTPINVTWKGPNGMIKQAFTIDSGPSGNWSAPASICDVTWVAVGDTIRAESPINTEAQTLKVLRVSGSFDRSTDVVSGRAPASSSISIRIFRFGLGPFIDEMCSGGGTTDASGRYAVDWTNCDGHGYDAAGRDFATTTWQNGRGDTISYTAFAPSVGVTVKSDQISGFAAHRANITVRVRTAGGILRGTAHARADRFGAFSGVLKDSAGHAVKPRVGDRVEGDWTGSPVGFAIPPISTTWNVGDNTIRGHCLPNVAYRIYVVGDGSSGNTTNGNGNTEVFDTDDTGPHDLVSGDVVEFSCLKRSGDVVGRRDAIP